jgi:hypothetical protein
MHRRDNWVLNRSERSKIETTEMRFLMRVSGYTLTGNVRNTKISNTLQIKKDKAVPVTGRGGPQVCETSRIPNFLDSRLTDSVELSALHAGIPLLQKDCWYSFLLEAESSSGP